MRRACGGMEHNSFAQCDRSVARYDDWNSGVAVDCEECLKALAGLLTLIFVVVSFLIGSSTQDLQTQMMAAGGGYADAQQQPDQAQVGGGM